MTNTVFAHAAISLRVCIVHEHIVIPFFGFRHCHTCLHALLSMESFIAICAISLFIWTVLDLMEMINRRYIVGLALTAMLLISQKQQRKMSWVERTRIESHSVPSEGWGNVMQNIDFNEYVISSDIKSQRNRRDGYTLFIEQNVWAVQSNRRNNLVYFKSVCAPAMKTDAYNVLVCLVVDKNKTTKLWARCDCPAGVDGECKHVVATLFKLHSLYLTGADENDSESLPACTSRLQMWHVKRAPTDEPLFFTDINFSKPYKTIKKKRTNYSEKMGAVVKNHNPLPAHERGTTEHDLKQLVGMMKSNGYYYKVLSVITSNSFVPVEERKEISECDETIIKDLHLGIIETEFENIDINITATNEEEDQFLETIKISRELSIEIEKETRLQAQSMRWRDERAALHGIQNESAAFALFTKKIKHEGHCSVGLIVNPKIPFVGASPDRLVRINGEVYCVEIKCPFRLFDNKQKIKDAITSSKFNIKINSETKAPFLNPSHEYYSQLQGQLMVCNLKSAYFVVFVPPRDIEWVVVRRDESHISITIQMLRNIYQTHFLPYFSQEMQSALTTSLIIDGTQKEAPQEKLAARRRRLARTKRRVTQCIDVCN
ncbi:hypothetical protein B566_EDAN012649 [Ephemera danica]|nr:hypothetical protein B566_EDAN012649 [Ephemera danica]